MKHFPTVSIITVTFNAEKFLTQTIESVKAQTYPNIEYIIIDGGSEDNTLSIIRSYESFIDFWHSEPDKGLYDAMNKGLQKATGEYVWFINAGDEIYDKDILQNIFTEQSFFADVYYGDTEYYDLSGNYIGLRSKVTPHHLPEKLSWKSMAYGMVVCHQAIIVRRSISPLYWWEEHLYSADIDWVIEVLKRSETVVNTQKILAKYLQGGFSRKHLKRSLKDRFKILSHHFGLFPTLLRHGLIVFRGLIFILRRRKTY